MMNNDDHIALKLCTTVMALLFGVDIHTLAQCEEPLGQPNIVVIMVDDMGFSDIGCYGAETETPHLDALSKNGLRFTQFYNTGRCCPTRSALLTGLYQHQAGIGHMTADSGYPSYQGFLNDRCVTIAEALDPAGYFTAICGKWHVGSDPEHWPLKRGFDRFYGTPNSYNSFGTVGANMCDTPFRKYKSLVHEGGIATPLVAHWPNGIPETLNGTFKNQMGHVIDLLPTCIDVAGATYPLQRNGQAVTPVAGRSLKPVLAGAVLDRPEGLYFEHQGNAAVRIGKWKLVRTNRKPWELQQAIDDAPDMATIVCDSKKTILISKTLFIRKAITLKGLTARLPEKLGQTPMIVVEAEGVTLADIELHGNYKTVSQKDRAPMIWIQKGEFTVKHCKFSDGTKDGVMVTPIEISNTKNVTIEGLRLECGADSKSPPISFKNCQGVSVSNVVAQGLPKAVSAVLKTGCKNVKIEQLSR